MLTSVETHNWNRRQRQPTVSKLWPMDRIRFAVRTIRKCELPGISTSPAKPLVTAGREAPMSEHADLEEKTDRYGRLLAEALAAAEPLPPDGTPLAEAAVACEGMARSYLEDGRQFHEEGDLVNALAAFSYGHGWLDAGARLGLFGGVESELFAT